MKLPWARIRSKRLQRRPCVQLLSVWSPCCRGISSGTWAQNGGRDLPAEDAANSQAQEQQRIARSVERWFSDLNRCTATAGTRTSYRGARSEVSKCKCYGYRYIYIYRYIYTYRRTVRSASRLLASPFGSAIWTVIRTFTLYCMPYVYVVICIHCTCL